MLTPHTTMALGLVFLAAACQGPPRTSAQVTVATTEAGLLATNGLPSNGLPSNGLPSNGLPSNGLPSNGLPSNGLPSNGLSQTSINSATFANWFHWFQGCTTANGCNTSNPPAGSTGPGTATSRQMADTIMKYIVECACTSGTTLTYNDRVGASHSWSGLLGLAPAWCSSASPAATVADQEWVSACLLAVTNSQAGHLPIGVPSIQLSAGTSSPEQPQLNNDGTTQKLETTSYWNNGNLVFGTFGNIFGNPSSGQKGAYAVISDANAAYNLHVPYGELGRDCAVTGCGGVITPVGCMNSNCLASGPNPFPDVHGHNPPVTPRCVASTTPNQPTSCNDNQGRTWTRILSVANPNVGPFNNYWYSVAVTGAKDANGVGPIASPLWNLSSTGMIDRFYSTKIAGTNCANSLEGTNNMSVMIRYISTASANLYIEGNDPSSAYVTSFTLPSTNGYYAWATVTFSEQDQTLSGNTGVDVTISSPDATGANANFDSMLLSIPSQAGAGCNLIGGGGG